MFDNEYNSEDENFEEHSQDSVLEYKPSYVVVALDTHPSMFCIDQNGQLPFRNCLEACYRILDSLVMVKSQRRWNPFAIVLKRENFKFIGFDDTIFSSVKVLQSKLKLSDQELQDEFQSKNDGSLAEFLLGCKKTFSEVQAAFYKRTLVFITNNDNPVKDAQSKFAAINEVKSFESTHINFQVVPTNEAFDFTLFYNEILAVLYQDSFVQSKEEFCTDADGLEQKLSSVLVHKLGQKKVEFYPFRNDLTRILTCLDMKLVKSEKLLNTKLTHDGETVKRKHPVLDPAALPTYTIESQSPLAKEVVFDYIERDNLFDATFPLGYTLMYIGKMLMQPGYCYQTAHVLQVHHSETTDFFKKFWDYCVQNDRVLISVVKYKKRSSIRFCQMSPILIGESPMFLCKNIPYGNEINILPDENLPKVESDEKKKEIIRKLVEKLTIEFHPDMIPDPKYRKKFLYIKSKLLDEPFDADQVKLFDKKSLDERAANEIELVKNAFGIFNVLDTKNKRKKPTITKTEAKKKK